MPSQNEGMLRPGQAKHAQDVVERGVLADALITPVGTPSSDRHDHGRASASSIVTGSSGRMISHAGRS